MSVAKTKTVVNLCQGGQRVKHTVTEETNMAVIMAPGGRLTPLLSTGFPHSSVFAMTVFGLTFCGNGSSLFVTALLPFGHEIREQTAGLQRRLSYCCRVADCALGFRTFRTQHKILNAAL